MVEVEGDPLQVGSLESLPDMNGEAIENLNGLRGTEWNEFNESNDWNEFEFKFKFKCDEFTT